MFAFFLGALVETLLGGFFTGCTCWIFFGYVSTIGTLEGLSGEDSQSNIFARDINVSLRAFMSVTSGLEGDGFCSAQIIACVA